MPYSKQIWAGSALALLLLFSSSSALAAVDLKALEKRYAKLSGFEADFVQEVYQATLSRTKSSKGAILLKRPALVRWEIHEPEKTVLVSNGKRLWYYTPNAGGDGKGQVILRPARELAKNPIVGILNGSIPIEKEFDFKGESKEGELTFVSLKPKQKLGDVEQVVLGVDEKSQIQELKLEHSSGNRTRIRLQNLNFAAKLSTNLFQFTPPPGVDIVRAP